MGGNAGEGQVTLPTYPFCEGMSIINKPNCDGLLQVVDLMKMAPSVLPGPGSQQSFTTGKTTLKSASCTQ